MSNKEKTKKEVLRVRNVRVVYSANTYNALPPQRLPSNQGDSDLTRDGFQGILRRASRKIQPEDEKGEK